MSKKPKPPPRPLDKVGFKLRGWTANKVAAIKAKREAAKGKSA